MPLVHTTGMVNIARRGSEGTEILDAYTVAMDAFGIGYERFGAAELMRRWPQFRVPDDHEALYQPDGGILDIRKAGAVHVALARAPRRDRARRRGRDRDRAGARPACGLITAAGTFEAEQVVVCAGAWTRGLLQGLGVDWPIRLTQEQVTYYATPNLADFAPERFPIWLWHGDGDDEYYGFPVYGEVATKAAQDLGGPEASAEERPWRPDPESRAAGRALRGEHPPRLHRPGALHALLPLRHAAGPRLRDRLRPGPVPDRGLHRGRARGEVRRPARADPLASWRSTAGRRSRSSAFRADRPALADPGFAPALPARGRRGGDLRRAAPGAARRGSRASPRRRVSGRPRVAWRPGCCGTAGRARASAARPTRGAGTGRGPGAARRPAPVPTSSRIAV